MKLFYLEHVEADPWQETGTLEEVLPNSMKHRQDYCLQMRVCRQGQKPWHFAVRIMDGEE